MKLAQLEALGHPVSWAKKKGLHPVYFHIGNRIDYCEHHLEEVRKISSEVWGMHGYAGLMCPWHDREGPLFTGEVCSFNKFFWKLDKYGINYKIHCYLMFPLAPWEAWSSPNKLLNTPGHLSWMRKLNDTFTEQQLEEVARGLYHFLRCQINFYREIRLEKRDVIRRDVNTNRGSHAKAYHNLGSRIAQLHAEGVPFDVWVQRKMEKWVDFKPDQVPSINTIVNRNGLDPSISILQQEVTDPWNDIRSFLGLSHKCSFPDGCIPKGWQPIKEEYVDPERIAKISKDGHYILDDGTQRRGRYHYMRNTYLAIRCTPDNFLEFKKHWNDKRYMTSTPTWEEYQRHALHPGFWDAEGNPVGGRSRPVKWRKR